MGIHLRQGRVSAGIEGDCRYISREEESVREIRRHGHVQLGFRHVRPRGTGPLHQVGRGGGQGGHAPYLGPGQQDQHKADQTAPRRQGRDKEPQGQAPQQDGRLGGTSQKGHPREAEDDAGTFHLCPLRGPHLAAAGRDASAGAAHVPQSQRELQQDGQPFHPGRGAVDLYRYPEGRDTGKSRRSQRRGAAPEAQRIHRRRRGRDNHPRKQGHDKWYNPFRREDGKGEDDRLRSVRGRCVHRVRAARVRRDPDHRGGREGDHRDVEGSGPVRQHNRLHIAHHQRYERGEGGHSPAAVRRDA